MATEAEQALANRWFETNSEEMKAESEAFKLKSEAESKRGARVQCEEKLTKLVGPNVQQRAFKVDGGAKVLFVTYQSGGKVTVVLNDLE